MKIGKGVMPDRRHYGKQSRTYKHGSEYINEVLGSEVESVNMSRVDHAGCVFASRHRDDDAFRQAEALARASAILHDANEKSVFMSEVVTSLARRARTASYEHLVKWAGSDDTWCKKFEERGE